MSSLIRRFRRTGSLDREGLRRRRIYNQTETTERGCWEYQGARTAKGYPVGHLGRRFWALFRGPIPDGLHLLHKCDNPPCINPRHLYLGTHSDNMRDAVARGRHWQTRKTHCKHGHEFTSENTGRRPTGGRYCRTCQRMHTARWRQIAA